MRRKISPKFHVKNGVKNGKLHANFTLLWRSAERWQEEHVTFLHTTPALLPWRTHTHTGVFSAPFRREPTYPEPKPHFFGPAKNHPWMPGNPEAQQRYFSYRAILVAIVSQNFFVLVFVGVSHTYPAIRCENNSDHPHPPYLQKMCPQNMPYKRGSVWHKSRLNSRDFYRKYGIRTPQDMAYEPPPLFVPYEPFLLGVGVVFNLLSQEPPLDAREPLTRGSPQSMHACVEESLN